MLVIATEKWKETSIAVDSTIDGAGTGQKPVNEEDFDDWDEESEEDFGVDNTIPAKPTHESVSIPFLSTGPGAEAVESTGTGTCVEIEEDSYSDWDDESEEGDEKNTSMVSTASSVTGMGMSMGMGNSTGLTDTDNMYVSIINKIDSMLMKINNKVPVL